MAAVGSDGSAYRGRRVRSAIMKSWDAKRANSRVVWSEIGCLRTRVTRFAHAGSPVIKGLSLAFCYSLSLDAVVVAGFVPVLSRLCRFRRSSLWGGRALSRPSVRSFVAVSPRGGRRRSLSRLVVVARSLLLLPLSFASLCLPPLG